VSEGDQLILRPVFWPRLIMFVGSAAFLIIGSAVWIMTGEFSGFSLFAIAISSVILVSIVGSLRLSLALTPQSISQRGLLTSWEVKSHELKSWQLVRETYARAGYECIVVRSEGGEHVMSRWIVTSNRRYALVLNWLRTHFGSREIDA
jgi:hypothetical protein